MLTRVIYTNFIVAMTHFSAFEENKEFWSSQMDDGEQFFIFISSVFLLLCLQRSADAGLGYAFLIFYLGPDILSRMGSTSNVMVPVSSLQKDRIINHFITERKL